MTRRVVLYIDSLKTGGAERVTLLLARWLTEAGWQATVLTRHSESRDFYPVPAGVQRAIEPDDPLWLRRVGQLGFPLRVLRLHGWLHGWLPAPSPAPPRPLSSPPTSLAPTRPRGNGCPAQRAHRRSHWAARQPWLPIFLLEIKGIFFL